MEAMEEVVGVMEEEETETMEMQPMVDSIAMEVMVATIRRRRRWTKLLALRYGVLMLLLL